MNSASATTITVNTSLFSAGDTLILQNISTGVCTVTAGTATVSTAGSLAIPQNGSGILYFTSAGVSIFYPSAGAALQVSVFNETQASGTQGGASATGSFLKRTLNTTVTNGITSCTLTSSVISLPAGSYLFSVEGPFFLTESTQLRLRNTTASTTIGISNGLLSGANVATQLIIFSFATLTTTSNIEVQYQCGFAKSSNGLGPATAFGDEVYSQIQITKVA